VEESQHREMVWMPALPGAVLTLIITSFVFVVGTAVGLAALVTLVVRAGRRQWTPLTWLCLGSVIGALVFWVLVGLHAVF
jgi:uncharacterized membrane protein